MFAIHFLLYLIVIWHANLVTYPCNEAASQEKDYKLIQTSSQQIKHGNITIEITETTIK